MSSTRKRKYDDVFKVVNNQHECQKCFKRFAIQGDGGTTVRKRHLEICPNKDDVQSKMRQQTLPEMGETSLSGILNELCFRLIAKNDLPFSIVEDETFQALVRFQCPSQIKIPDRKIISNESLDKVAKKFKNKLSRNINPSLPVSIQFDEYSNKRVRLITVTLTQISGKFEIKTFRLGVKSLDSLRANAANLKEMVNGILNKFEIKNLVSATRDGALNALCAMLEIPSVHCINHVQNIAVQEGYNKLKGSKIDDIKNCVSKMI
uniref:BED-type domain-containing protein n=1 Tax=Panagrolaimus sp. JU765 TaxID=591449 RepID=A0AC34Q7Y5_9BILA